MSVKIVLLICIISYSNGIIPKVNSSIISSISTGYERIRAILDKHENVTRVRTTAELHAKGNEFATLDFIGLVQQYNGYKAEEYDVQTEDGYILKLHRISSSPLSPEASNKPVIFMMHCLAGSSDIFVIKGPNKDLAFQLADAGYDIWLGNVRGNFYSKRHVKYLSASTNYDFWNFNLDDIATKDVPIFIDYVLKKTNKSKLIYIGFVMGNTLDYILLSSKPEYNDKINLSISLSPVAYLVKPYPLFLLSDLVLQPIIPLVRAARLYELLPLSKTFITFIKTFCTTYIGEFLCAIISPIFAFKNLELNTTVSLWSVTFNSLSLDTVAHFGQLATAEKFRKFDFGPRLNQEKYNSSQPPEYDLSKVTAPHAIFYAVHDSWLNPKGAEKLKNQLPNVISFEKVPESYRTYDLIWAKNARTEYFHKILNYVKKFS